MGGMQHGARGTVTRVPLFTLRCYEARDIALQVMLADFTSACLHETD